MQEMRHIYQYRLTLKRNKEEKTMFTKTQYHISLNSTERAALKILALNFLSRVNLERAAQGLDDDELPLFADYSPALIDSANFLASQIIAEGEVLL